MKRMSSHKMPESSCGYQKKVRKDKKLRFSSFCAATRQKLRYKSKSAAESSLNDIRFLSKTKNSLHKFRVTIKVCTTLLVRLPAIIYSIPISTLIMHKTTPIRAVSST